MSKEDTNIKFKIISDLNVVKAEAKEEEGKWIVTGYASTPAPDRQGEVVTIEALKDAEKDLLQNSTVFYEHKHGEYPVGKVIYSKVDDKGLFIKVIISQTAKKIWTLIKEGVLNKFSIGGKILDKVQKFNEKLGKVITYIKELELLEVSVVGLPANVEARTVDWYISKALQFNESETEKKEGSQMSEEKKKALKSEEKKAEETKVKKAEDKKAEDKKEVEAKETKVEQPKAEETKAEDTKKEEIKKESKAEAKVEEPKEDLKKAEEEKKAEVSTSAPASTSNSSKALVIVPSSKEKKEEKVEQSEETIKDEVLPEDDKELYDFEDEDEDLEAAYRYPYPYYGYPYPYPYPYQYPYPRRRDSKERYDYPYPDLKERLDEVTFLLDKLVDTEEAEEKKRMLQQIKAILSRLAGEEYPYPKPYPYPKQKEEEKKKDTTNSLSKEEIKLLREILNRVPKKKSEENKGEEKPLRKGIVVAPPYEEKVEKKDDGPTEKGWSKVIFR